MPGKHIPNHQADILRECRTNIPEVVFARFKDDDSLVSAVRELLEANGRVLVTKCTKEQIKLLSFKFKGEVEKADVVSGTLVAAKKSRRGRTIGSVAVLSAGTSDYFAAEEASMSAEFFGLKVFRHYDCGVAGIHRLKGVLEILENNNVDMLIVVAGMEGALPSIVSGLVRQPIIAVPTSVGYGASLEGLTALLAMLNSCSPGIVVVNIDNGFGAAASAYKTIQWLKGDD